MGQPEPHPLFFFFFTISSTQGQDVQQQLIVHLTDRAENQDKEILPPSTQSRYSSILKDNIVTAYMFSLFCCFSAY